MQNLLTTLREALQASDVEATKSAVAAIVAADKDRPADEYINGSCHPSEAFNHDKYFQSFETACIRFVVDDLSNCMATLDEDSFYVLFREDRNGPFGYARHTDDDGRAWWFFDWGGGDNCTWCFADCINSDEPYFEDEWDETYSEYNEESC